MVSLFSVLRGRLMLVQGHSFFSDMPEDVRYFKPRVFSKPFIEKTMVFVLPEKLKDFRRSLWHVRKCENEEGSNYIPLFRAQCILTEEAAPAGLEGPYDVYPFYSRVPRNKRHYLDYYMLFLFRSRPEYAKFCALSGEKPAR